MRRLIAPLALAGALAAPASAAAEDVTIRMPGKFFEPARVTTVAGDRLTFRNNDLTTHDVKIGGGVFDSGPIGRFTQWSQAVEQPGEYPFVCTLHAFMSGNLSVVAATAKAAPQGVLAGEPLTVSGRTRPGAGPLALERSVAGGAWEVVDPAVAVDADGAYAVKTPAVEGASYRVATPAGPGQVVTPSVTAKVEVAVTIHHGTLHVTAKGAPKGMVATLERYSRWHFRWRARRSRPIRDGAAMFMLGARRSYVRVALRRSADAPALVRSGVVKSWNGRLAQDPDSILPPVAGHHGPGADEGGSGGHGGH